MLTFSSANSSKHLKITIFRIQIGTHITRILKIEAIFTTNQKIDFSILKRYRIVFKDI